MTSEQAINYLKDLDESDCPITDWEMSFIYSNIDKTHLSEAQLDVVKDMREKLHAWYLTVDAKFLRPMDTNSPKPWAPF